MKQKKIKTDKATLLVCELPEGAKFIRIETNQAVVPYGQEVNYEVPATKESYGYEETEGFALPEGNWQLLGRLPDITEEQVDKVVDSHYVCEPWEQQGVWAYKDYCSENTYVWEIYKSLSSLLQENEIYFENPIKFFNNKEIVSNGSLLDWQESQSKVWGKERTFLFIKVD